MFRAACAVNRAEPLSFIDAATSAAYCGVFDRADNKTGSTDELGRNAASSVDEFLLAAEGGKTLHA